VPFHLQSPLLASHGFRHGFSLRTGGVSEPPFDSLNLARSVGDRPEHVSENLQRLASAVGYPAPALHEISQVHGTDVIRVTAQTSVLELRQSEADALISDQPGRAIGVRVADCVAVLLADPASGAVAAVHAGWRGTAGGILARAVAALSGLSNAPPQSLLAALFPHIGPAAFEVGLEVAEQIEACAPGAGAVLRGAHPRPHVDLSVALLCQLRALGLGVQGIDRVAGCTFSEPSRFFSFRRDGQASGRHLAVIVPRC